MRDPVMPSPLDPVDGAAGTRGTVLVIDDSVTARRYIEAAMRHRPHVAVLSAPTGAEGLDMARHHRPGLILLDGTLPDATGMDVLRALKTSPETEAVPVVIVSGSEPRPGEPFERAGADAYLLKPIALEDLFAIIDRHIPPNPDPVDPSSQAPFTRHAAPARCVDR